MQAGTSGFPPPDKGAGGPPAGFVPGFGAPPQQAYGGYPPQPQQQWGTPAPQQPPPQGWPQHQQAAGYPPQQHPPQGWPQQPQPPHPAPAYGASAVPPAANGNTTIGSGSYVVRVGDPDMDTAASFADTVVRNGFVRKVFGIVGLQLAFTVGIACIFMFTPSVKLYVRQNQWVFWVAWIFAIGLLLVISCVEKARRVWPTNMILLAAFTAAQAFLVGTMTAFYSQQAVIIAFAVTSASVIALSLFAINTKVDVTRWGTLLLVALVAFIVLLLIGLFWVNNILWLVLSGIACLLFSAYLIYDIQLVMGGRYYSISPDEYVFAALSIYLDIINLFMWMLTLIGLAGGNN